MRRGNCGTCGGSCTGATTPAFPGSVGVTTRRLKNASRRSEGDCASRPCRWSRSHLPVMRQSLLRSPTTFRALEGAFRRGASSSQEAGERELEGAALHLATLVAHDGCVDEWSKVIYPRLLDLRDRGGLGSPLYDDGLEWLIKHVATQSNECALLLRQRAPQLAETPTSPDEDRKERARRARKRVMARMKARQDRFAALLAAEEA